MPDGKKKQKDLAENVLSDTEDESDDRAAASKIKVTKNLFSTSLFIGEFLTLDFALSLRDF